MGRREFVCHPQQPEIVIAAREHVIADTMAVILRLFGYPAIAAYSAYEVVGFFSRYTIRFALIEALLSVHKNSDITDGIGLAEYLYDSHPHSKTIIVGGEQQKILEWLQAPASRGHYFDALFYPVHPDDLLMAVRQVFG